MTALSTERVATDHGRDVLVAHIDDGKANALSLALLADLHGLVDMVERDDTLGALVLHGRPGMFSAGFDLSVVNGGDVDAGARLLGAGADLFRRLYGAPVPVVAACTGHAVAAVINDAAEVVTVGAPAAVNGRTARIHTRHESWALTQS
mgnify:CR=1 FL=1